MAFFLNSFSQREVDNIQFENIDDYGRFDSVVKKNKMNSLDLFVCPTDQFSKISCVLYAKKGYDESGRLKAFELGDDLNAGKVDYTVEYKKLSDTLYESVVKFSAHSAAIPTDLYIDTVVRGHSERFCLYMKDKDSNIVVKSLYAIDRDGLVKINRYDLAGNLQQIYYPSGNKKPKEEWADSLTNKYSSTVVYNAIYDDSSFQSTVVYDKNRRIKETSYRNTTFSSGSRNESKQIFIYDSRDQLVMKLHVDENNHLNSEDRYTYKNGKLVRYTNHINLSDSLLNEDRRFDDAGRIIFVESHQASSQYTTVWKYFYNSGGLSTRNDYYINDKLKSTRFYFYK